MKRILSMLLAIILIMLCASAVYAEDLYCRNCGKRIPSDSRFCQFCGTKVNSSFSRQEDPDYTADRGCYNGFYIQGADGFYSVSPDPEPHICTFYSFEEDVYYNIYSGNDVKITFYRSFEGPASIPQAEAFCSFLLDQTDSVKNSCYYFYWEEDGNLTSMNICLVEGWNFDDYESDLQYLWDRNPWMNSEGTMLQLEYLLYGNIHDSEAKDYFWNLGNSVFLWVREEALYGGISVGFKFTEGADNHTVRKYCRTDY